MGHQQADQYTYRRKKLLESLFKEIIAENIPNLKKMDT